MSKPLLVSTKKLSFGQMERLTHAGCVVVDYNAIKAVSVPFELPEKPTHWVFSSQNAVRALLAKPSEIWTGKTIFCVGEKTKQLLEKNGLKVEKSAKNMQFLVDFIQKTYKNDSFLHICGNRKLSDFSIGMQETNIEYAETEVYQTQLVARTQQPEPDGILFFSPSGVESYLLKNNLGESWCFCIGNTTASAVSPHSNRISIPKTPDIDLVIAQAAKHFRL